MAEHAYILTIFTSVLGQLVMRMSRKACMLSRPRLLVDRRGYDSQLKDTICDTCGSYPSI